VEFINLFTIYGGKPLAQSIEILEIYKKDGKSAL
jgi:hypothetical protein